MQGVITQRLAGLGLAAVMALTAAGGAVAVYVAGGPGENLRPVGEDASLLIDLTQVEESILWTSLAGNVSAVETVGWPSSDGIHDLGGALTITKPANSTAGTINIGEKPMSVSFSLE